MTIILDGCKPFLCLFFLAILRKIEALPDDWLVGSTTGHAGYGDGGKLTINTPSNTMEGHMLMLFLSRTDAKLPHKLDGWETGPSCLKSYNEQEECITVEECNVWGLRADSNYCKGYLNNENGAGRDLATIVFYKKVGAYVPPTYTFTLKGGYWGFMPGWAILVALKGVDTTSPIFSSSGTSNDGKTSSVFPSVAGAKNGILLMSMAFDDTVLDKLSFREPKGAKLVNWLSGFDEAGFLYSKRLNSNSKTGKQTTRGDGGSKRKDLMISLVLNAADPTSAPTPAPSPAPSFAPSVPVPSPVPSPAPSSAPSPVRSFTPSSAPFLPPSYAPSFAAVAAALNEPPAAGLTAPSKAVLVETSKIEFQVFKGAACRTDEGEIGKDGKEYQKIKKIDVVDCRKKCSGDSKCTGFEYSSYGCEVWSEISNSFRTSRKSGFTCEWKVDVSEL